MLEPLTSSQSRLQDDLRGVVKGDVRCDELTRQLYSSDGSPYQERPLGVVWPRSESDVAYTIQYAAEKGLSVHPRGSGTSAVGGAIGSGIILDFSRYMRRVLEIGDDYVRVEPGAVRERLNKILRSDKKRFFAPSSGHVPTSTIGGILAIDNIGPRWLRYGAPHESALELTVVSASGAICRLRPFIARREVVAERSTRNESLFRRRFLNAAIAEANAQSFATDATLFDPDFDSETIQSVGSPDAEFYGIDFQDGYGVRTFRSDRVRYEFFKRAFGSDAEEVRTMVGSKPWANVLRAIRSAEPYLDAEQSLGEPSRCGYPLRDITRSGFDPMRLFVGSEGSLGVITEAKLVSFPIANASCAVILLFDSIEKAAQAVPNILFYKPTLCDLLDSRVVTLVRDWDARFESVFPQMSEAALVIELDAENQKSLRERSNALCQLARGKLGSFGCWTAFSLDERSLFRDLLRKSSCARLRMAPSFQPFPFWDDVRVPVESTLDFLRGVQELFKREHIVYSVGGSIGFGQLSIQPILPYSDEEERRAFALSDEFEELVLSHNGEIGVAKGNGRVRTAVLSKRYPYLLPIFVKVKNELDPENRLNPDCVVSPEMRRLSVLEVDERLDECLKRKKDDSNDEFGDYLAPETDAALRESALHSRSIVRREPFDLERLERDSQIDWFNRPKRSQLEFQLAWDPTLIYAPTYQCNGCGHCRIRTAETRMCPAFRNFPDEQFSCRAKANLLRGVVDGDLELAALTRDMAKRIAERCVRCHCCSLECPAQVDVAKLAFRLTSAYRAASGLNFADLFAVRAGIFLNVATLCSTWIIKALGRPGFRWALERTLGIARKRMLPKIEKSPYLRLVAKRRSNSGNVGYPGEDNVSKNYHIAVKRPLRKVALFIDSLANFFDVKLVEATIKILEWNGVDVITPQRPATSGMVAFALGDVDRAGEYATRNVSTFREIVRDGSEIVTLEPSSAVCIKQEYPYFCNDSDAKVAYSNTTDVCSYLARLLKRDEFDRDSLKPIDPDREITIGYHAPCRSIALSGAALQAPTPAQALLACIPGLNVRRIERGCCGFAGYSGFTKRRFAESLHMGGRLILATRDAELDMCVSECSFCNMQLAQGSARCVVHALKLLAVSYGFMTLNDAKLEMIDVRARSRQRK